MLHPQGRKLGVSQAAGEAYQYQRLVARRGDQTLERAQEIDDPVSRQWLLPGLSSP
jgi:hypothetical protein